MEDLRKERELSNGFQMSSYSKEGRSKAQKDYRIYTPDMNRATLT
jgi:hypothetical protein